MRVSGDRGPRHDQCRHDQCRQDQRRLIGGHARTAGGLAKSGLTYIEETGATVVQVYVSNSRGWARPDGDPEQDATFRAATSAAGIAVYIHACLLVNLGSPTPATVANSVACLRHALRRGQQIGAAGVVFHAGSAVDEGYAGRALHQVGAALRPVLDEFGDGGPRLYVEPSAGGGRCLAKRVEDLGPYLATAGDHPAFGVCFDTCHAWAAGHDLATPGGMTATLDRLIATVGVDRIGLIHANDSKDACGSTRDRHENIGKGSIGGAAFAELLAHPALSAVPVLVETPSEPASAGHAADIAYLRRMAVNTSIARSIPASSTSR
jgi:deoxyribonuclease-4